MAAETRADLVLVGGGVVVPAAAVPDGAGAGNVVGAGPTGDLPPVIAAPGARSVLLRSALVWFPVVVGRLAGCFNIQGRGPVRRGGSFRGVGADVVKADEYNAADDEREPDDEQERERPHTGNSIAWARPAGKAGRPVTTAMMSPPARGAPGAPRAPPAELRPCGDDRRVCTATSSSDKDTAAMLLAPSQVQDTGQACLACNAAEDTRSALSWRSQ